MSWSRSWFQGLITAEVLSEDDDFGDGKITTFYPHINGEWIGQETFETEEEAIGACLSFLWERGVPIDEMCEVDT